MKKQLKQSKPQAGDEQRRELLIKLGKGGGLHATRPAGIDGIAQSQCGITRQSTRAGIIG